MMPITQRACGDNVYECGVDSAPEPKIQILDISDSASALSVSTPRHRTTLNR